MKEVFEWNPDAPREPREWIFDKTNRDFEDGTFFATTTTNATQFWITSAATSSLGTLAHSGNFSMKMTFGSLFIHGNEYAIIRIGTIELGKTATFTWYYMPAPYANYTITQAAPTDLSTFYRYDDLDTVGSGIWGTRTMYFSTGTVSNWYLYVWIPGGGTNNTVYIDDVSVTT